MHTYTTGQHYQSEVPVDILLVSITDRYTTGQKYWYIYYQSVLPVMTMPNPYLGLVVTPILVQPLPSS